MAKKIYIGNMLQEMQSAIADLQTDMGTMSTDMASMVSELIALKETMGQGVGLVNVKGGITKKVSFTHAEKAVASPSISAAFCTFKCRCNGYITIGGNIRSSVAGKTTSLWYSKNGAADVQIGSNITLDAFTEVSKIIDVAEDDVIAFKLQNGSSSNTSYCEENGTFASYELVDIVNDGATLQL